MSRRAHSRFDELIDEAVTTQRQLARLNEMHKLTFAAFYREALRIAGCDNKRITALANDIETKPGTDTVRAFVRRLTLQMKEFTYTRPHSDAGRLVRIYGTEQAESQIAQLRATVAEVQALAVRQTHEQWGDAIFGDVEDFERHKAATTRLQASLEALHADMRVAFMASDIVIDTGSATPEQRAAGLCRVSFVRATEVSPAMPDWPRQLIDICITQKPNKTRSRLAA